MKARKTRRLKRQTGEIGGLDDQIESDVVGSWSMVVVSLKFTGVFIYIYITYIYIYNLYIYI